MPMYNLLEYNDDYSMISGSMWHYYSTIEIKMVKIHIF